MANISSLGVAFVDEPERRGRRAGWRAVLQDSFIDNHEFKMTGDAFLSQEFGSYDRQFQYSFGGDGEQTLQTALGEPPSSAGQ